MVSRMQIRLFALSVVLLVAITAGFSINAAFALPFNSDMVDAQLRTGSVMRPSVPGTVPMGSLASRVENKAEAEKLTNPIKGDAESVARGKRLFAVNCAVCHSDITKTPWVPSVVGSKVGAPDLRADMYVQRTDGNIYGTIHFGGMAIMPAYGWKLSPNEHWDLINYVRSAQKAKNGK